MRRPMFGLAFALGVLAFAPAAQAQGVGFSDPFFLYYGFYLPRQASIAAQPSTPSMIGDVAAARQNYALADRAGLYDPIQSPLNQIDPSSPFNPRNSPQRLPQLPDPGRYVRSNT